jgi:CheY-like chemotaxis protein/two-component sensor histidine kinase
VLREMRPDAEQQQRALQAIERGVRQQAQLVNDILDVSRIVAGKLQLVRERIDLIAVVEECVDQMTPQAREKGLEIASDNVDCGVVLGDRHRLRQLLTNLLTNAIKFTPAGGRIDMRCYRDGGEIVVALRDTGQGIEPEFLPHIFDRFTQADNVARPSTAGLGLGLSIVRQIADLHGGSVRAESDGVGKGSMFTLRMPLAPAEHEGGGEPAIRMLPSVRSTLDGLSILVVDDDSETRESLALLLASPGATVRHVDSAAAALDDCAAHPPDVIVSDISMPELDGYALIDAVRRQSDGHRPVAVARPALPPTPTATAPPRRASTRTCRSPSTSITSSARSAPEPARRRGGAETRRGGDAGPRPSASSRLRGEFVLGGAFELFEGTHRHAQAVRPRDPCALADRLDAVRYLPLEATDLVDVSRRQRRDHLQPIVGIGFIGVHDQFGVRQMPPQLVAQAGDVLTRTSTTPARRLAGAEALLDFLRQLAETQIGDADTVHDERHVLFVGSLGHVGSSSCRVRRLQVPGGRFAWVRRSQHQVFPFARRVDGMRVGGKRRQCRANCQLKHGTFTAAVG